MPITTAQRARLAKKIPVLARFAVDTYEFVVTGNFDETNLHLMHCRLTVNRYCTPQKLAHLLALAIAYYRQQPTTEAEDWNMLVAQLQIGLRINE